MKKVFVVLSAVFSVVFASLAYAATDYVEGEVLVVMKNSNNGLAHTCSANATAERVNAAKALASTVNAKVQNTYDALSASSGQVFMHLRSTTKTADEMIAELKNNPNVVAVSKNHRRKILSNSASTAKTTAGLSATATSFDQQWGLKKIGVEKAWQKTTGSKDIVVAVIDSGVMYNHPDLADNMWQDAEGHYGKMFYTQTDNLGYVSGDQNLTHTSVDITSGDISHDTNFSSAWWSHVGDPHGHGTHIAGVIGATGKQVNGVNQNVKILTVGVGSVYKNSDTNPVTYYSAISPLALITQGLDYITGLKESGVNIVAANMSLRVWATPDVMAKYETISFVYAALETASNAGAEGILFCIGAGNDSQDIDNPSGEYLGQKPYPAYYCMSIDNTLCVGASDIYDKSCVYSNYSSEEKSVQVFAPGYDILSTCIYNLPQGITIGKHYDSTGYCLMSGTSMATPMVTGAAALLAAAYPDKTAAEIKQLIVDNCADACKTGLSKYGRIDLAAAMATGEPQPVKPEINETFPDGVENKKVETVPNINSAAAITNIAENNLEQSGSSGYTYPKVDYAKTSVAVLYTDRENVNVTDIFRMPVSTGSCSVQGNTLLFSFSVGGETLTQFADKPDSLTVFQVCSDNNSKKFTVAKSISELTDGHFAILNTDGTVHTGDIDKTATYYICTAIKDGGEYDLDGKENGVVVDPTVIANVTHVSEPSSSSSGGCNAGFAALALAALAVIAAKQRKK